MSSVDALDLLFRRLVLAARETGALSRPIEVGEVLDKLVPYRSARRDGQLETNDDYLHAVMRLLSGERGLVFADETIQDDLTAELQSPNPDLALIKTYRNTKVRIATAKAQVVLDGDTAIDLRPPTPVAPTPVVPPPASAPRAAPRGSQAAPTPRVSTATPVMQPAQAAGAEPAPRLSGTVRPGCPYCAQSLPDGRPLKYCPSCGQNLLVRRCSGCSAEIESGWKFCVICGRSAA
jgi:hypothetical protein